MQSSLNSDPQVGGWVIIFYGFLRRSSVTRLSLYTRALQCSGRQKMKE